MRELGIHDDLKEFAFEFFYWFSRFEFALKENKILKSDVPGANAEPGWELFIIRYADNYKGEESARRLLELNPKRQKVITNSELEWKEVYLGDCTSELCRVIRLLKTIRNNLFHGGKHGAEDWDDAERTKELLKIGRIILDQLAQMADFETDYRKSY